MSVVLALNSGSSSLKLALFRVEKGVETELARASVDGIGTEEAKLTWKGAGETRETLLGGGDRRAAVRSALEAMTAEGSPAPAAIGHRLVHGGPRHFEPALVTPGLLDDLRSLVSYAPLHLPAELEVIEVARETWNETPQVVCFDTCFHRSLPEVARRLAIPKELGDQGIVRYGFHGLSYRSLVDRLGAGTLGRGVIAHLGSGSSMVAIAGGRSVDTSMGLTPAGGFLMGTRPGDLDPGVLLRLLADGWSRERLETMIEKQSGLLGVSRLSSDMRVLLRERSRNADTALAIEMYVSQIAKWVGAFTTVLGGLDTLTFTGGIGERSPVIRAEVCARLSHLGVALDPAQNQSAGGVISTGSCVVRAVSTDEEAVLARETDAVVSARKKS